MTIENIKEIIKLKTKSIPEIYDSFIAHLNNNENVIIALFNALKKGEEIIEKKHTEKYVTDDYENDVRRFTSELVSGIIRNKYYKKYKEREDYKKLLCQKHMAYSYYHFINTQNTESESLTEDNCLCNENNGFGVYVDINSEKDIYMGLVEFYGNFCGRFSDNQEAIELLCKYYPLNAKNIDERDFDLISFSLYNHIKYAGTPNDLGYAFYGIELIEKYIGRLPENIIKGILKFYTFYNICTQNIFRHQIVSIIMNSSMEDNQKKKIKFFCIDSILLVDYLNKKLIEKMKQEYESIDIFYSGFETQITDEIKVLKIPDVSWKRIEWEKRILYVLGCKMGEVSLDGIEFYDNTYKIEVNKFDWQMGLDYDKLLFGNQKKQILFSLLFLNNYRGLKNKVIEFDHDFEYDIYNKRIIKKNKNNSEHFYGEIIYSLTCLVGKNGTGKTSIIDFLRETFFGLLYIVREKGGVDKGFISEEAYSDYGIFDEGADFLVVFHLNEKVYYLTNIYGVNGCNEIKPLSNDIVFNINDIGKVAYFSNMLRADKNGLNNLNLHNKEKINLKDINLVDLSEANSFTIKNIQIMGNDMEGNSYNKTNKYINKDLFFQLFLLHNMELNKLEEKFNFEKSRKIVVDTAQKNDSFICSVADINDKNNTNIYFAILENYISNASAVLRDFSSGEYFKFILFSKLYYFLNGKKNTSYISAIKEYNDMLKINCMDDKDVALIFIDEGEVYYHPEWQRRYIYDLLDIISSAGNGKIQLILSTNSPFIISDIINEDIVYLSNNINSNNSLGTTLGQNIHKLLMDNFFMDATIGEYAKQFISDIATYIADSERTDVLKKYISIGNLDYDKVESLIELIGEPVYKIGLKNLLENSVLTKNKTLLSIQKQIDELNNIKKELEEELLEQGKQRK